MLLHVAAYNLRQVMLRRFGFGPSMFSMISEITRLARDCGNFAEMSCMHPLDKGWFSMKYSFILRNTSTKRHTAMNNLTTPSMF